jgi:radical SAM superfamily enzyme YgiQ (UPF0313 family)
MRKKKKQKKVLLIVLPYLVRSQESKGKNTRSVLAFPYGVLSMATYLKKKSDLIGVEVHDCNIYDETEVVPALQKKILDFKPDVIGISMMFDSSYHFVPEICRAIRDCDKDVLILLGGESSHTHHREILAEQPDIFAICYYEGELPMLQLLEAKDMGEFLENCPAWITRESLEKGIHPDKLTVKNLDEVIAIDYSLVKPEKYSMLEAFSPYAEMDENRRSQFFMVTSRGCPYICSFCHRSAEEDKSMRYSGVPAIVEHLKFLVAEYGMNTLTLYDDQLLMARARAKEFFREMAQFKFRIEMPNGLSPAFMDEEVIRLMSEAGVDHVCLAIESGSPRVLNKIIHKPLNLKQLPPVIENCKKYNIFAEGYFVIGMPGETDEDRQMTVELFKGLGMDWGNFNLAVPLKGTVLYRECIKNGWIERDYKIGESMNDDYVINYPGVPREYIKRQRYLMNLDCNFVNNNRMKIGDYKVAMLCFDQVAIRYPNHAFAHYFLSKALHAMGERKKAKVSMARYKEIVAKDATWREYAEYIELS